MTNTNVEKKIDTTFDKDTFIKECGTVSSAIRKLHKDGKTRSEIAKLLNKKYQHVRNVLTTPLKKSI